MEVTMLFYSHWLDLIGKLFSLTLFVVCWSEAKQLRRLFCLNMRTLQWHPMKHVRSLPVDQRLSALVAAANE
jgi:hypothetical protein